MTKNEAIKELKQNIQMPFGSNISNEASKLAIKVLEEIQQYQEIGTVEKFRQLSEQFKPHVTDKTSCTERHCNKCDQYRKENEKYHKIGTVEECQEARERQRAKKVKNRKLLRDFYNRPYSVRGDCPNCGSEGLLSTNTNYCNACGQKLDWSDTP